MQGSLDYEKNENDGLLQGDVDCVICDILEECGWLEDMAAFKGSMCENSRALLEGRIERESDGRIAKKAKTEPS